MFSNVQQKSKNDTLAVEDNALMMHTKEKYNELSFPSLTKGGVV